ncbi:sigma-54-dependent transcriptional regulator [Desulfococcus sp.]|uniref:sigma-54-dependent transcriptional regulator n=1 Tax=Desulfococcus sp. TaxID=2025834 RepID=UPI0035930586
MNILIVDDDAMQRELLMGFLRKKGYDVAAAANGRDALAYFAGHPVHLVILDHRMPDLNGDAVLAEMKRMTPLVRAIMVTAYGSVQTAVEVMKLGADDFLEKPVDLMQLLEKVQMIAHRLAVVEDVADVAEAVDREPLPINLVGDGPAMQEVISLVRRVAPSPWTVLISGETGTGKELIARLVHLLGPSGDGPFVEVNCGAVPENLFESELFGHEKGAFTGAAGVRRGRFELAGGGTLFLDEIGELPLSLQPKLLRALQEKRFCRVGGEREITAEVRVVAATNRDLRQLTAEGRFREDLYYRLNVFDIVLPPLRERKEDIPELVDFFLQRFSMRPVAFDPGAMMALVRYSFPGNVRELEHIVQRAVTLVRGSRIREIDLPPEIRFHQAALQGTLAERVDAVEREMIQTALEKHDGVQTRAAASLGISERVLRYKIKKHRLQSA